MSVLGISMTVTRRQLAVTLKEHTLVAATAAGLVTAPSALMLMSVAEMFHPVTRKPIAWIHLAHLLAHVMLAIQGMG